MRNPIFCLAFLIFGQCYAQDQSITNQIDSLIDQSFDLNKKGRYEEGIKIALQAFEKAKTISDSTLMSRALNAKGYCELDSGIYEIAIQTNREALAIRQAQNDTDKTISSLGKISTGYFQLGDQTKALEPAFEGLELSRLSKNLKRESMMHNLISSSYTHMSLDSLARHHLVQMYRIDSLRNDSIDMAIGLANISITYEFEDPNRMESYMEQSYQLISKVSENLYYRVGIAMNYSNILLQNGNYTRCIELVEECESLMDQGANKETRASFNLYAADAYLGGGSSSKAIPYAKLALDFGNETENHYTQRRANEIIAECYHKTGNNNLAYKHAKLANEALRLTTDADARNEALEIQYEYDYKMQLYKDSVDLANQNELMRLDANAQIADANAQRNLIIGLALAGILLGLLFLQRIKTKQREHAQQMEINHQDQLIKASVEGQEKERERLAKDLHDDVGAMLSTVKMNLAVLDKKAAEVGLESNFTQKTKEIVDQTVDSVRRVSQDLDPPGLRDEGLNAALARLIDNFNEGGSSISFEEVASDYGLDSYQELICYRITQEMLNNSVKHANASKRLLSVSKKQNGSVVIQFEDNGQGFDLQEASKGFSSGIGNMQSRARSINAEFSVDSSAAGTTTILTIPQPARSTAA